MQSWPAVELPRLPGRGAVPRVHDTSSGAAVPAAAPGSPLKLYVCGITPYDATHLGHAATCLGFDLLVRATRDAGVDVRYVQNVTDVDDPLLERARRDGVDWRELADREIERFRGDMTALRVLPPAHYVGAVEAIPEIADVIVDLRDRGAAYDVDGDVYLPVSAAPHFGEVSGVSREQMLALFAERGGDPDRPGKRDPLDSLLWRAARPGEPCWESPLGPGRPGWHVECAAIALRRLGEVIDVQGGGSDLAFPHHEHSSAATAVATGVWPVARAYVHAGMVGLDGEKMSKSRGNLVFVSRLRAEGADPAALRLALLGHHYRSDWEWTEADLPAAVERLDRWRAALAAPAGPPAAPVRAQVRAALADDLDAPGALAAVDSWATATLAGADDEPNAPDEVRNVVTALLGVDTSS